MPTHHSASDSFHFGHFSTLVTAWRCAEEAEDQIPSYRRRLRRLSAVHHTSITGAIDAARRLRSETTPPSARHGMDKLARVQDEINEATDVMYACFPCSHISMAMP